MERDIGAVSTAVSMLIERQVPSPIATYKPSRFETSIAGFSVSPFLRFSASHPASAALMPTPAPRLSPQSFPDHAVRRWMVVFLDDQVTGLR